ncbi:MAG: CHAT domain-containing protein, partial [bacterium]
DSISEDTAIVYVIPLMQRLELLLGLPSGMKRVSVPVSADTFAHEVRILRKRLEKRTTREYLPHAQRLYNWLIRPLEADLASQQIRTLVFIPDETLRTIPLAALHDGNDFLISRYAVATTQGLSLIDPSPIKREKLKILLAGLTESVQGYPALENVSSELHEIYTLYGGTLIINQDFCVSNFKKNMEETAYSGVHIASHGAFESSAQQNYVLAWDDTLSMDQLERFMLRTRFRKTPVELLTLSACETAAGDNRSALGLAGIAIKAGAKSALATLWHINDQASSQLVVEFYRHLYNKSVSKAKALQQAQRAFINDSRYNHPCYWAPFLMIGNWL